MDGTIAKTTTTNIQTPAIISPTTTTTTTATTTIVRSTTTTSSTIPTTSSSNNKSIESKSSSTKFSIIEQNPDLVQNNLINCSIKNKRKNFNPRYSSANEIENLSNLGGDAVDQLASIVERDSSPPPPSTTTTTSTESLSINKINAINKMTANSTIISSSCNNSSNFNSVHLKKPNANSSSDSSTATTTTTTISMNWRKLLETQQQYNNNPDQQNYHHHNNHRQDSPTQQKDRIVTINNCARNNPIEITRRSTSHQIDEFNKQFYKIPNTNFTITKSQVFNDGGCHQTIGSQQSTTSTTTATSADPQSKMEFAYNAFNAVQELLNVYGLSISPGDIVDAFKKQQQQQQHNVGGCPQPPTPPRTPISTTPSSTSTILPSTSTTINNGQSQHQLQQSLSKWCNRENDVLLDDDDGEDVRRSSTPLITFAPVSKLMASTSSSPTPPAAQQSSSLILINNNNSSTNNNNNNNNHNSQSNCSNDDCGGDESTTIDDDDDEEIGEKKDHHYNHHSNSNFSDRDEESGNLYDLNQCFNDDSNISSTDDPGSDGGIVGDPNNEDCGDGGGDGGGGGGGGANGGTCSAGVNSGSVGRLSVKNVESLLDKCSMSFFSPMLQLSQMQNEDKQLHTESMKYLTKFGSYLDCKTDTCQLENLREHYHCYDLPCLGKTLSKKEEIIRHLKWHKKRAESLNHGFLRFSSSDDCSATFGTNCTHNRKQTHYHCFQPNCDKVYISTSDVQMHSNYHRKDSAIYQEGFQRFRATEECNADYCMFAGQRTTHFHCRRDNCRYTFKNKADMEKHKSYHIKDLQLARDGFKKFLKTESCPYERCRFSRICNHIHCVRENCHYVLHSSGQLLSHKRKHERIDSEQAYRRFKMVQKAAVAGMIVSGGSSSQDLSQQQFGSKPSTPSTSSSTAISPDLQIPSDLTVSFAAAAAATKSSPVHSASQSSPVDLSILYNNPNLPLEFLQQIHQRQQQLLFPDSDEPVEFSVADVASSQQPPPPPPPPSSFSNLSVVDEIEQMIRQCFTDNCSRQRPQSTTTTTTDQIEPLNLKSSADPAKIDRIECFMTTAESHLHCLIKHCEAVVPRSLSEITEHMRMHELNRNAESIMQNSNLLQITSIEGFFNRKRGRPPKNRVVEVYNNTQHQSPQAIFTSFKLEKNLSDPQMLSSMTSTGNQPRPLSSVPSNTETKADNNGAVAQLGHFLTDGKIQIFHDTEICGPIKNTCIFSQQMHFHCNVSSRCHFATKYARAMERHLQEFHDTTADGSSHRWNDDCEYFDQVVDCMVFGCSHSRVNSHFHCMKCRHSTFSQAEIERHLKAACRQLKSTQPGDKIVNSLLNNNNDNSENDRIRHEEYEMRAIPKQQPLRDQSLNLSGDKSGEDAELDCSLVKSESSEDEKVSVVRAAGTYFPQNSENTTDLVSSSASHQNSTSTSTTSQSDTNEINMCQRPFCKLKKKLHQHCEICNQAFSDKTKLKIHRLQHSTTRLGHLIDSDKEIVATKIIESTDDQPQDLTKQLTSPTSPILGIGSSSSSGVLPQILPQNFVDNFSMQNIHLAHLALCQQNPFYYQHFYPFLGSQNLPSIAHAELLQSQFSAGTVEQQQQSSSSPVLSSSNSAAVGKLMKTADSAAVSLQSAFPFAAVAAAAAAANSSAGNTAAGSSGSALPAFELPKIPHELFASMAKYKRKTDDFGAGGLSPGLIEMGMQPAKKMLKTNKHGNFKIFKDEPIPHGYLKFRFNEDCNFPNCGYRNHQSHFHCCRNDCYYSFCDKTRFVQHTARHERLDKLMGDDFKQYRANMRCGYEDCAYNKNLGQNNKSSHFHCLKCNFICSDTNKVVAHRRQHSKMEFIRMAGFRKVANNEKCGTTITGSNTSGGNNPPTTSDNDGNNGGECAYSLKQTHYHCLICDCSVLSRAQLGSHRHRVQ